MANTIRIKRRSSSYVGSPSQLAASELAFNETPGGRVLYYGLGNDGYGTATSVIAIAGPDFNPAVDLTGVISSSNSVTSITSQTGTGTKFVVDNTPTLITPILGVASATSINKVTITQPDTSATLTIYDNVTLTVPSTGSISGTNTGDNAVNTLYSSLVSNATHTGDATGSTALTVVRINGQSLAALATGILKNTTGTGVPSIAVASDFPILNQSTTGNAATVTTNANLSGVIYSTGNTTYITSQTGTGSKFVVDNSPTLITPDIGVAVGTSLTLSGDLVVNGSTVTLNATTLDIEDKNIVLGNVMMPSEYTADGGGITLKSSSDKYFTYSSSTTSWTSSENINLYYGKVIKFNGTTVLSETALDNVTIDGGSF